MKSIEWSIAIFFGDASFNQQTVVAWSWVFHPAGCTQLFHRCFRFGQVPKSGAASPSVAWRSWSAWMLADTARSSVASGVSAQQDVMQTHAVIHRGCQVL